MVFLFDNQSDRPKGNQVKKSEVEAMALSRLARRLARFGNSVTLSCQQSYCSEHLYAGETAQVDCRLTLIAVDREAVDLLARQIAQESTAQQGRTENQMMVLNTTPAVQNSDGWTRQFDVAVFVEGV